MSGARSNASQLRVRHRPRVPLRMFVCPLAGRVRRIGNGLRAVTGTDQDTGMATQPYHVAGTVNYPKKKSSIAAASRCRRSPWTSIPRRNGSGGGGNDTPASAAEGRERAAHCRERAAQSSRQAQALKHLKESLRANIRRGCFDQTKTRRLIIFDAYAATIATASTEMGGVELSARLG